MISAHDYVANSFYGDKEKAVQELKKWVKLYQESPKSHTPKVIKRIGDYKRLIDEINAL